MFLEGGPNFGEKCLTFTDKMLCLGFASKFRKEVGKETVGRYI